MEDETSGVLATRIDDGYAKVPILITFPKTMFYSHKMV